MFKIKHNHSSIIKFVQFTQQFSDKPLLSNLESVGGGVGDMSLIPGDIGLFRMAAQEDLFTPALSKLVGFFDVVLMDCPPSLSVASVQASLLIALAIIKPTDHSIKSATLPIDGTVRIELEEGVPIFRASSFVQTRIETLLLKPEGVTSSLKSLSSKD